MGERRNNRTAPRTAAPAAVDGDDLLAIALPSLFQFQPPTTAANGRVTCYSSPKARETVIIHQPPLPASSSSRIHTNNEGNKNETNKKEGYPNVLTTTDNNDTTYAEEDFIRGKLARRAYHLPGNTCCQDYAQYLMNCHLIFGLCCHDKRSPVHTKHRLLLLLGSLALGLIITNVLYLWGNEVFHDDEITSTFRGWATTRIPNYNETTATIDEASTRLKIDTWSKLTFLWTAGSAIHAASDMLLWHTMSCGYCSYTKSGASTREECQLFGWVTAIVIVMFMVIVNCVVAYFRVFPLTDEDDIEEIDEMRIDEQMLASLVGDDEVEPVDLMDFLMQGDFSFIWAFHIEFALTQLVWTPIFMTTLFSGVLGCGRMPCIGGRPREVWKERNGKDGRGMVEV